MDRSAGTANRCRSCGWRCGSVRWDGKPRCVHRQRRTARLLAALRASGGWNASTGLFHGHRPAGAGPPAGTRCARRRRCVARLVAALRASGGWNASTGLFHGCRPAGAGPPAGTVRTHRQRRVARPVAALRASGGWNASTGGIPSQRSPANHAAGAVAADGEPRRARDLCSRGAAHRRGVCACGASGVPCRAAGAPVRQRRPSGDAGRQLARERSGRPGQALRGWWYTPGHGRRRRAGKAPGDSRGRGSRSAIPGGTSLGFACRHRSDSAGSGAAGHAA